MVEWEKSSRVAKRGIMKKVSELIATKPGRGHFSWKPEFNCSCTNLDLIDEYQLSSSANL
jgi:hypothetical protein